MKYENLIRLNSSRDKSEQSIDMCGNEGCKLSVITFTISFDIYSKMFNETCSN